MDTVSPCLRVVTHLLCEGVVPRRSAAPEEFGSHSMSITRPSIVAEAHPSVESSTLFITIHIKPARRHKEQRRFPSLKARIVDSALVVSSSRTEDFIYRKIRIRDVSTRGTFHLRFGCDARVSYLRKFFASPKRPLLNLYRGGSTSKKV